MKYSSSNLDASISLLTLSIALLFVAIIALLNYDSLDQYLAQKESKKQQDSMALAESNQPFDFTEYIEYFSTISGNAEVEKYTITDEKVLLGKHLYFDTRLSKDGNNSCNSCHNLSTYGVDNKPFSPGDLGHDGGRNSPTSFNAALHFVQFWDGREPDVEAQAGGPILNPDEMNIPSKEFLIERLSKIDGYVDAFKNAFPGDEKSLTYWSIQQAIGAFERTLITPSRFDQFINGDTTALNAQEKRGLVSFVDNNCTQCHNGSLLGGNTYQKFGIHAPYWEHTESLKTDEGRFQVTQNESDKYMFKVPSLRNVEKTYPYFHDGSVADLASAVKIMAKVQLNKELSDEDTADIVAFLGSLTGDITEEQKKAPRPF